MKFTAVPRKAGGDVGSIIVTVPAWIVKHHKLEPGKTYILDIIENGAD